MKKTTVQDMERDAGPIALPLVREVVEANPAVLAPSAPDTLDRSTMFLTYLAFLGDVPRTAAALMIDPAKVQAAAEYEGWDRKVTHLKSVKSSMGPDEFLRELNRVVNFVQSLKLRAIMDRILVRLTGDGLNEFLVARTKDTENASCKAIAEIVKACEAVHRMTYTALGDSPARKTLTDGDAGKSGMALSILGALSAGASPSAQIADLAPAE
jgi:hypothetical protein